jgi:hypothetical protein
MNAGNAVSAAIDAAARPRKNLKRIARMLTHAIRCRSLFYD